MPIDAGSGISIAQSRITAQGQVSIPLSVMRQFGLEPGSVITWNLVESHLVIEKTGQYGLGKVKAALNLPIGIHKTQEGIKARTPSKHAGH